MSLLLIALLQFAFFFANVISSCSTTSNVEITFYGYPDGPSDTTSFGCSGTQQVADGTAGGDGSYAHPETFATALNNPNFTPCEIIYIPLFQKYFQYMDHCEKCLEMYPSTTRIDLWIGSDVNGGSAQTTCEQDFGLKTGQTIVHDPPSDLKVNGGQLWDNDSGTCGNVDLVFPNYSTNEADLCGGGSSSSSGSSPAASPSSSAAPPPASTSSTPAAVPSSKVSEKEEVAQAVNVKANVALPAASSPAPTTLATVVSSSKVPTTSASPATSASAVPAPSSSSSSSGSGADCGVTADWPTAWLGHCVGAPCKEFNDCSGELICQGWPNSVCTSPRR